MFSKLTSLAVAASIVVVASSAEAAYKTYGTGAGACPPNNLCLYQYGVFGSGEIWVFGSGEANNGYDLAVLPFANEASALVNNTPYCIELVPSWGGLLPLQSVADQKRGNLGYWDNNSKRIRGCGAAAKAEEVALFDAKTDASAPLPVAAARSGNFPTAFSFEWLTLAGARQ